MREHDMRVGILREERRQLPEIRRRLQHPALARASPLEQLEEAAVRPEHGREVGARQPAAVARHRVRAHEVVRRELRACRSAGPRWGRRRRSRASSGTRARSDARTCTPDRRPRSADRSRRSRAPAAGTGGAAPTCARRDARDPGRAARAAATCPTGRCRRRAPAPRSVRRGSRGCGASVACTSSRLTSARTISLRAMDPAEQMEVGLFLERRGGTRANPSRHVPSSPKSSSPVAARARCRAATLRRGKPAPPASRADGRRRSAR